MPGGIAILQQKALEHGGERSGGDEFVFDSLFITIANANFDDAAVTKAKTTSAWQEIVVQKTAPRLLDNERSSSG